MVDFTSLFTNFDENLKKHFPSSPYTRYTTIDNAFLAMRS